MKSPLDDPQSREFYESSIPFSPESTDGRSAWWNVLEIVAVWGTALCVVLIFVGWLLGHHLTHKPTAEELYGCKFSEADKHGGECP